MAEWNFTLSRNHDTFIREVLRECRNFSTGNLRHLKIEITLFCNSSFWVLGPTSSFHSKCGPARREINLLGWLQMTGGGCGNQTLYLLINGVCLPLCNLVLIVDISALLDCFPRLQRKLSYDICWLQIKLTSLRMQLARRERIKGCTFLCWWPWQSASTLATPNQSLGKCS